LRTRNKDSTFFPSLFLKFRRTWRFLINIDLVLNDREHHLEAFDFYGSITYHEDPTSERPETHNYLNK